MSFRRAAVLLLGRGMFSGFDLLLMCANAGELFCPASRAALHDRRFSWLLRRWERSHIFHTLFSWSPTDVLVAHTGQCGDVSP
jgi:hypothetical protein